MPCSLLVTEVGALLRGINTVIQYTGDPEAFIMEEWMALRQALEIEMWDQGYLLADWLCLSNHKMHGLAWIPQD